jgi:phosphoribosylanthranilate isomerase
MIHGIRLKVCGLTSLVDAEQADAIGADYLGFILYPPSPRYVSWEKYRAMSARLPTRRRVAVSVEPGGDELAVQAGEGFDRFQIHFRPGPNDEARLERWSRVVGRERLWLAPKLPPGEQVSAAMRRAAEGLVVDTFHADGFGGSGLTGDWAAFARLQQDYRENTWILAGGLKPENIAAALAQSGARFVDVNSGVESAPGVKDAGKLKEFAAELRRAAARPA